MSNKLNVTIIKDNLNLYLIYILINVLIGNISIKFYLGEMPIGYYVLINISILIIHSFAFIKTSENKRLQSKFKIVFISISICLFTLLLVCVFTAISMKLSTDNIFTATLKGMSVVYLFAIVFSSPVWILLSLWNYICLKKLVQVKL